MNTWRSHNRRGFTLVELLVVIVIIAVLSALLLTAISAAHRWARRATAQTECKNLELAWKKYYTEYHRWPSRTGLGGISDHESDPVPIAGDVMDLLKGVNKGGSNPKKFVFMIFDEVRVDDAGNPVNPWRRAYPDRPDEQFYYYVKLDADFDNDIEGTGDTNNPPVATVPRSVAVWTKDDRGEVLASWEL